MHVEARVKRGSTEFLVSFEGPMHESLGVAVVGSEAKVDEIDLFRGFAGAKKEIPGFYVAVNYVPTMQVGDHIKLQVSHI